MGGQSEFEIRLPGRAEKLVSITALLECVFLLYFHTVLYVLFLVIVKTQNNDYRRFSLSVFDI